MKVIIDAFGGDNAPEEIIKGCADSVLEYGVEAALCGDEEKIRASAAQMGISLDKIKIVPADGIITMEDDPNLIVKDKKGCSMAEGMRRLAEGEYDAFVTAGSTGAAVMGSTFIVKRIKGVKRAALAPIMPSAKKGIMVIDIGANAECRPEMLVQFALMSSIYMEYAESVKSPKVGLLNIGVEETKGTPLQLEAYRMLKKAPLNFIGNIEAREIPSGNCDIIVTDGFSGNIVLKLTEGVAMYLFGMVKSAFKTNAKTKLAAAMMMPQLKQLKKKMDYTEYGGAPLIGISKPVIKAHGSSDANALKNAVRQAIRYSESGVISKIEEIMPALNEQIKTEQSVQ